MPDGGRVLGSRRGGIRAWSASGVGRTVGLVVSALWPLALGYAAWVLAADLWGELIASLPRASRAYAAAWNAWPAAALAGPVAVMAAMLMLRRHGWVGRASALASIAPVVAAALVTAWPELQRLQAAAVPWPDLLRAADVNIVLAVACGLLAAIAGLFVLGKTADAAATQAVTRARTDAFGHADWMPMSEARRLFDGGRSALGGVVIGEADRVDRDRVAGVPFDPRELRTWGRGGTAPLLVFDLSWGGTHGLVFAGSGGYKTVSTCVPTLLTYRGPVVTLDPSAELAPMLTAARAAMGRRVVCVDPARPEDTGFNALDWLDTTSPQIDTDIRAVVDWICGERPAATSGQNSSSGKLFFEGRGKAMVEALLSDLVFAAGDDPARRTLAALADRLALPEAEMRDELERIHQHSPSPRARPLAGQLMGSFPTKERNAT